MSPLREAAIKAIENLPEDASLDDILEEIIYYAKLEEGLRDADAGRLVSLEEVKARFNLKV